MGSSFVLVHGAWHGGWVWARVQQSLLAAGRESFAPTLDGLSERARPGGHRITIQDHANEILSLLDREQLRDTILVGHSYAGNVISVVADRLKARAIKGDMAARQAVKHYVFLDAAVPRAELKEFCWGTDQPADLKAARIASIQANQGMMPVPPASAFGLHNAADANWITQLMTPMPGACYTEPVAQLHGGSKSLPRTYITATQPAYAPLAHVAARVRTEAGWNFMEMPSGHEVMLDRPRELTEYLLSI